MKKKIEKYKDIIKIKNEIPKELEEFVYSTLIEEQPYEDTFKRKS